MHDALAAFEAGVAPSVFGLSDRLNVSHDLDMDPRLDDGETRRWPEPATHRIVYVIDPDASRRLELSKRLRCAGADSVAFASAADAMRAWSEVPLGCGLFAKEDHGSDSLDTLRRFRERRPDAPMVMMDERPTVSDVVTALHAGATSFLELPATRAALSSLLEKVFADLQVRMTRLRERRQASARFAALTRREREVIKGIVFGKSNLETARMLEIGVRTVEMHRANAMQKIGAESVVSLMWLAFKGGLLDPGDNSWAAVAA